MAGRALTFYNGCTCCFVEVRGPVDEGDIMIEVSNHDGAEFKTLNPAQAKALGEFLIDLADNLLESQ